MGPELSPSGCSKVEAPLAPGLCLMIPRKLLHRCIQAWPSFPGLTVGSGTTYHKRMFGLTGWVGWDLVPHCCGG